jgi:hypothetical protein
MASLNRRRWSAVSSPMATRSSAARLWPGVPPGGRGGAAAGRRMPRQGRWRPCRRFPGRPRHAGGPRCRSPADPPPAPTSGPGRRSGRSRVPWGRCGPDALRADGPGTRLPAGAAPPPRPGAPGTGGRRPPQRDPPQRLLGVQLAVQLPEVEEGRRLEQGVLLRLLDPVDEPVLPGRQWHPTGRVGGHHVAGAAGEAAAFQGRRQRFGQGREPAVGSRRGGVGHHQGRVLVGAQRAFLAGAAAQHQQRIRAWRRPQGRLGVARSPHIGAHRGRWPRTG